MICDNGACLEPETFKLKHHYLYCFLLITVNPVHLVSLSCLKLRRNMVRTLPNKLRLTPNSLFATLTNGLLFWPKPSRRHKKSGYRACGRKKNRQGPGSGETDEPSM